MSATDLADGFGNRKDCVALIQARLGSTRLPGKVLSPIAGIPALDHLIARVSRCELIDAIILAIPESSANDPLAEHACNQGIGVYRGSERDVLGRFAAAILKVPAKWVTRLTADCPMVDPSVIDELIRRVRSENLEYANTDHTFADGFDVEVFSAGLLLEAAERASLPYDREHVTPFIRRTASRVSSISRQSDHGKWRVTLDEPEDLTVIRNVFEYFGHNKFSIDEVEKLMDERPELFSANRHLVRNQGAVTSTGQKLWRRAVRVIPGGNMLLSKRAEMHLPGHWPAYFKRASGCRIWDLDENEFLDVGWMAIGTNILGYGDARVDAAVRGVIDAGNLSTLNCPEEVLLAEKLCEIHPWADMVRFTRSGGEAGAVATRIARAASGRDGVAFCGYHGWHDWYLAANLAEDSALDGHLLPGLEPVGVPRGLLGTAAPFTFNDSESLERLLASGRFGVVFMEVERSTPPWAGFLQEVRSLADRYSAVLVFDECTSGFRKVLGGIHLHHGVNPDIAVLGKTLGNGYAINAVIGRAEVMQAAQSTFISSTFWTERIGPTAALAALQAMVEDEAPRRIDEIGHQIRGIWSSLAGSVGLRIQTAGLPALSTYAVEGRDPAAVKSFVVDRMLARGFLSSTAVYASTAHTPEVLEKYADALGETWTELAKVSDEEIRTEFAAGGLAHTGFSRLA